MAKLEKIRIEHHANSNPAIRIDWDNDRHQRIEIAGRNPIQVMTALKYAALLIEEELKKENI